MFFISVAVESSQSKPKSKRIFYFDALRALAIICVIILHVFATVRFDCIFYGIGEIPSFNWIFKDFFLVAFRLGVDLFLILSGALSLGRVWDIKSFLGKRIPRIVKPYLFWGIILSLFVVLIYAICPGLIYDTTIDSLNLNGVLTFVYNLFMGKTKYSYSYWFFWMILGTYLIMPVFNKWILHSDLKEIEYFLIIWLVTCIFDFTLFIEFPIKLTYFVSPMGLVVLGYYLRHTKRKLLNNPYFAIFLIIISIITGMIYSYFSSSTSAMFKFDRYSIFMMVEVIGVFMLFKNFDKFNLNRFIDNSKVLTSLTNLFKKATFSLAKYSYGIYLIHYFFISVFCKYFQNMFLYKKGCFILFLSTLAVSWILMALLNKIPHLNNIIGAK